MAQAVANLPSVQLSIIGASTKEMRKRLFELRQHASSNGNELWIRGYTSSMTVNDVARSKLDVYGVEAGYDRQIYNNNDDVVYLGLMAGFTHTKNIRHHTSSNHNGSATGEAPSIGLYGVWFNAAGWFAYANLRHFWLDMDAKGYTYSGDLVTYNPDRNFVTANFELGKQFEWQIEDNKRKLIVEPSVELHYAYAGGKSFSTSTGYHVHYDKTESLKTRAALLLGYNYQLENKAEELTSFEPYVEFGIYEEWQGRTDVTYAGTDFRTSLRGTCYDATLGVNVKFYDTWSAFADVTYEKSLSSSRYEGLSGQVGIKYSW